MNWYTFNIVDGVLKEYTEDDWRPYPEVVIPDKVTKIGGYAFEGAKFCKVIIPNSVKKIAEGAFQRCSYLKNIVIPPGVEVIGDSVFEGCERLEKITVFDSVKQIGKGAFLTDSFFGDTKIEYNKYKNGCYIGNDENPYLMLLDVNDENLKEFKTHTDTKYILSGAFDKARELNCIDIGKNVSYIDNTVFNCCDQLEFISVDDENNRFYSENGNLYMHDGEEFCLFRYAPSKEKMSFVIPDGVTSISGFAFFNCDNLRSLVIPNTVCNIEKESFSACSRLSIICNLSSLDLMAVCYDGYEKDAIPVICDNPNKMGRFWMDPYGFVFFELMGQNALIDYQGMSDGVLTLPDSANGSPYILDGLALRDWSISELVIPGGISKIEEDTFKNFESLQKVTLQVGVDIIGRSAFAFCNSLTEVFMGEGVREICDAAFMGCRKLNELSIPKSVKNIGEFVFKDCDAFNVLCFRGIEPPTVSKYVFGDENDTRRNQLIIYVPKCAKRKYKTVIKSIVANFKIKLKTF